MVVRDEVLAFQKNVRSLCIRDGVHLGDFEVAMGLSRGYISKIGKMRDDVRFSLIYDTADYFDVSVDDLIYGCMEKGEEMEDYKKNYDIQKNYGVVRTNDKGATLEVNLVSWFGKTPKVDIRYWDHKTGKPGKGLSITEEEYKELVKKLPDIVVE